MSDLGADAVLDYLRDRTSDREAALVELLRIPSVSADPAYASEVRRAGTWIADRLASAGLTVTTVETGGPPILIAKTPPVPNAPTVLVYGHYDVQPPDPLDEWITPPFEPTIRDGNVVARGATDDKGQMLTHVLAVEAWMAVQGHLPVNVTFLIEGEEEVSSAHLFEFLDGRFDDQLGPSDRPTTVADVLRADLAVISDSSQFGPGQPAITYGLRGIAYFELRLSGPKQDLHSGTFGGGVTNPAKALAQMLAALSDEDGRVTVPGFYDDVMPLSEAERAELARLPFDEAAFAKQLGVAGFTGETGYSTLERRWARPSFDVNGLWGGYQGAGPKTVLPARAGAKFSFRLVPHQDPKAIAANLRTYLESLCPAGLTMELIDMGSGPGVVVPVESPAVEAARRAIETGFGVRPLLIREGGSIPIVGAFRTKLGIETLLLGWGLDDDNTHSPNEKFHLADFHRGTLASAALLSELATLPRGDGSASA